MSDPASEALEPLGAATELFNPYDKLEIIPEWVRDFAPWPTITNVWRDSRQILGPTHYVIEAGSRLTAASGSGVWRLIVLCRDESGPVEVNPDRMLAALESIGSGFVWNLEPIAIPPGSMLSREGAWSFQAIGELRPHEETHETGGADA